MSAGVTIPVRAFEGARKRREGMPGPRAFFGDGPYFCVRRRYAGDGVYGDYRVFGRRTTEDTWFTVASVTQELAHSLIAEGRPMLNIPVDLGVAYKLWPLIPKGLGLRDEDKDRSQLDFFKQMVTPMPSAKELNEQVDAVGKYFLNPARGYQDFIDGLLDKSVKAPDLVKSTETHKEPHQDDDGMINGRFL